MYKVGWRGMLKARRSAKSFRAQQEWQLAFNMCPKLNPLQVALCCERYRGSPQLSGKGCCDWLVMSAMGKRWDVVQGTGIACYLCFAINHFTSLHFFLQIEGLWQTCVKQVYQCHFSNFLCHVLVILPTFQPFSLYCNVYGDLWSVIFDVTIAKRLPLAEGSDDG